MNTIEIEVTTINYMGKLTVEPLKNDFSLFAIYLDSQVLGTVHPIKKNHQTIWYSHQITDKELLEQIGEWIDFHYVLIPESFKEIYKFGFLSAIVSIFRQPLIFHKSGINPSAV